MSNLVMIWYLDSKKERELKKNLQEKFSIYKGLVREKEEETTLQGSERNKKISLWKLHDCSFGNLLYFDYVQALRVTLSYFHFEIGNSCSKRKQRDVTS